MKGAVTLAAVAAALLLGACAEKAQTAATKRSDGKPWEGAQSTAYTAPGWKAGDATGWAEQLKTRAQNQNEYTRAPAQP